MFIYSWNHSYAFLLVVSKKDRIRYAKLLLFKWQTSMWSRAWPAPSAGRSTTLHHEHKKNSRDRTGTQTKFGAAKNRSVFWLCIAIYNRHYTRPQPLPHTPRTPTWSRHPTIELAPCAPLRHETTKRTDCRCMNKHASGLHDAPKPGSVIGQE